MVLRGRDAYGCVSLSWGTMSANEIKCWYERQGRQGRPEESRASMAGRLNQAVWERERDDRMRTKTGRLQPRG